ncbi:MAG: zf-TFIIB domain-containing protein [Actinobacteria bacterium]|nr:zf-TFIIB domain-containing protein [Actinomycetota bacterium]
MSETGLCPVDATELRRLERSGVQIDACPACRGVWLDRGELDKILERESAGMEDFEQEIRGGSGRERDDRGGGHGSSHGKKKKRSSILGEFLDFG